MRLPLRWSACNSSNVPMNTNAFSQTMNLNKTVNMITSNKKANENMKHLGNGLIVHNNPLQYQSQEHSLLQISCEQKDACNKKLKSNQDECEKKFQQITKLLQDVHCTSYDGTFIWKIRDVSRKITET
ncbi:unnamed protein product [Rotaria sp. Silwood2]|nr:unnamed protein product [Rotaria sp. Silwood2]CAF4307682.1 unnamed protein product [Rotaria sp. Silwood2]